MRRSLAPWLAFAVLMTSPLPVLAQTSGGNLAALVPTLVLSGITLPGASDPGSPHAGHFTLGNPTFGGSQAASQVDSVAEEQTMTLKDAGALLGGDASDDLTVATSDPISRATASPSLPPGGLYCSRTRTLVRPSPTSSKFTEPALTTSP